MTRAPFRPDLARKIDCKSYATSNLPARPTSQPPPGRPALRAPIGLLLAAGVVVAALVLQSSYGGGQADCRPLAAAARFNAIIAVGKSAVTRAARAIYRSSGRGGDNTTSNSATASNPAASNNSWLRPHRKIPRRQHPQRFPDQTQLLQTIARDLANLERTIEQLKANQQQVASDNSKAIGELKATQEEMKRALAKVSEPNPPRTAQPPSPPPTQPARALRKPERTVERPQVRTRPRIPKGVDLRRRLVAVDPVIIAIMARCGIAT